MHKNHIYGIVLAAACLAALVAGYHAMIFSHLPSVFAAPEEDMDYAWFVPLFSLAVLWSERGRLVRSLGEPSFAGVLFAIPFLAIGFLGARGLQVRFELLGFAGLLVAIPWAFFGRATAARVAFPAACLLFCMPMASYLSVFTVHLRLATSAVAGVLLSIFAGGAVRDGNLIAIPGVLIDGDPFVIDIADPCSGLRSIFALLAISIAYGYYSQPTWKRRAALTACAVPIAMAGNIVRIVSIGIAAKVTTPEFAMGYYHDFSGFVVFAVSILLFMATGSLIDRIAGPGPAPAKEESAPEEAAPRKGSAARRAAIYAAATLAVAVSMAAQVFAPAPSVQEPPEYSLPEVRGFSHETLEPSVAETNLLRGARIEKRVYSAKNGFWFQISAVTSGPDKSSLHRPELCLPSQGFDIAGRAPVEAGPVPWRRIRLAGRAGSGDALFAYTFFNQSGCRTSSHEARIWRDVWDRTVRGEIDRWTMVTVFFPSGDERAFAALLEELGGFAR